MVLVLLVALVIVARGTTIIQDTGITTSSITATSVNATTWLNGTQINALGFWWNGQNRTDAVANPWSTASYMISTDGTNYYAKNGTNGQIDFQSINVTTVWNYASGNLTSGRTWKEKILMKGNFTINSSLYVPSYTILEIQGKLTLLNGTRKNMIENADTVNGNSYIEILGGELDGNKANIADAGAYPVQSGIYLGGVCTNIIIKGVTIRNTVRDGILIGYTPTAYAGPQKIVVTECTVLDCGKTGSDCGDAISGIGCVNVIVSNNKCFGMYRHGVIFRGSRDITIEGNICNGSIINDGICLYNSKYTTINGNVCSNNTNHGIVLAVDGGIGLGPCSDITISNNICYGAISNHGIGLTGTAANIFARITVTGNTLLNNKNEGIYAVYVTDSSISGNTAIGNRHHDIYVLNSSYVTVTANVVYNATSQGILIETSNYCSVSSNICIGNPGMGIYFLTCANCSCIGNTCQGNGVDGIDLYNTADITIVGSVCTGNSGYGIRETGTSDYTLLVGNDLRNNTAGAFLKVGANTVAKNNLGYITENSGSVASCVNGTWIATGLAGQANGECQLKVNGSRLINATCYVMDPTIIAENSTHVQIEFLCNNAGTIVAVGATEAKTILWYFEYKP